MKIIMTGASGFVGKNFIEKLQVQHDIETLSARFKTQQQFNLDSDAIIHLAGKAHDLKQVSVPRDYYEANFELTRQLFDSFLSSKASIFIFMSTVKAVADSVDTVLTEATPPTPQTHYGISKLQAEQYILQQPLPAGKRVFILRPSMIHGPGNKGNLNLLYQFASRGWPWPLGAFTNSRSFLSIENLCFVVEQLLSQPHIASGVYNVADSESISTNQLIHLIAQSRHKQAAVWNISKGLIRFLARIGDKISLPFNSERLGKLTENYKVSNDKIVAAIGLPFPVGAEAGFLKTFESFLVSEKN